MEYIAAEAESPIEKGDFLVSPREKRKSILIGI